MTLRSTVTPLRLVASLILPLGLSVGLLACGDKDDDDGDGGSDTGDTDTDTTGTDTDTDTTAGDDADGDGYTSDEDCDDGNADVNPGATEVCDDIDNDCDDLVDDADDSLDLTTGSSFYSDGDSDGYGTDEVMACAQPAGTATEGGDCADDDATINPGADEVCNGIDDNCDDVTDDDAVDRGTFFADDDGDGYGDASSSLEACELPKGASENATDCDDDDASVYPGAPELCNGVDDDCDSGTSEEGTASFVAADGTGADWTAAFDGTSGSPADVLVDEEGTLSLCEGTFYASIQIDADATVQGQGPSTVVDATGGTSAIWVQTDGITATVTDLEIVGGSGQGCDVNTAEDFGGGLFCEGDSALVAEDVDVSGGSTTYAAGVNTTYCDTTFTDVTVHDNTAASGVGGALLTEGDHVWTGVEVSDNEGTTFSGGVYLYSLSSEGPSADFEDVVISGNSAAENGGLWMDYGTLTMTGTSAGAAGITDNADDYGYGAVYFGYGETSASFDGVDFGTDDGGDDNEPYDILHGYTGFPYGAGDDASFDCDLDGCGEPVTYVNGTRDGQESLSGYMIGNVILADTEATLESFWMDLETDGSCTTYLTVFSADDWESGTWTLEASASVALGTEGGVEADVGVLTEPGLYYFVGAAFECTDGTVEDGYDSSDPETDMGFGEVVGYAVMNTYEGTLDLVPSFTSTSYLGPYMVELDVTEL